MFTNTSQQPRAVLVSLDHPLHIPSGNDFHIRKRDSPVEHPFLATENISLGSMLPPDFLYRHHLESFFYILLYCASRYGTLPARPSKFSSLPHFFYRCFDRYGECGLGAKLSLFKDERFRDNIFRAASEQVLGADEEIQLWLRGLWEIFKYVRVKPYVRSKGPAGWDVATLDGSVTYEEFMAVLAGRGRVIVSDRSCTPRCAMLLL